MKSNIYSVLLILLIFIMGFYRFWTLADNEIQPWDESMYALRAISVVENGNLVDQTVDAPGGLYISSHPPLFIWLTSATIYIFGVNEYSVRIWSTIFYILLILSVYLMATDKLSGLIAAFLISTTPILFYYAGFGQLDVCYVFFVTSSLLSWNYSQNHLDKRYIYFSGCLFGLALMSKIIVGLFIPITIASFLLISSILNKKIEKSSWKDLEIVVLLGIVFALPWHSYMYMEHGQEFIRNYAGFHLFSRYFEGVESNISALGPLYYINQILIASSIVVIFAFHRLSKAFQDKDTLFYLTMFLVPFLIFTFSSTKLSSYTLSMISGISLLAGRNISILLRNKENIGRLSLITFGVILVWSISQEYRNEIKSIVTDFALPSMEVIIISMTMIFAISLIFIFWRSIEYRILLIFSGLFLITRFFQTDYIAPFDTKIREIEQKFTKEKYEKLIYIEGETSSSVRNPQIAFYFRDADKGIKQYNLADIRVLNEPSNIRSFIILNASDSSESLSKTVQLLNASFNLLDKDSRYYYYKN